MYFGFEFPAIFSCAGELLINDALIKPCLAFKYTEDCAYAACFICAVNGINRVDEAEEVPFDEWQRRFFCCMFRFFSFSRF